MSKPAAIITTTFTTNFTPDKDGKVTTGIKFGFPEHPDLVVPESIQHGVLETIRDLATAILSHPKGPKG